MKFEKVSLEEFERACFNAGINIGIDYLMPMWEDIKLPTRATSGSAGYDFYMPFDYMFLETEVKGSMIPTGIKAQIDEGWALWLLPKSGLSNKYNMRLKNTIGLIDSDYYNCEANEGHIMAKILCDERFLLEQGDKFVQGVFLPYGLTDDDKAEGKRTGGFGSTGE